MQRSDRFGRGMAETLQLAATPISVPVPGPTQCADGHVWGEPDLDCPAELMQQVAARRLELAVDPEATAANRRRTTRLSASGTRDGSVAQIEVTLRRDQRIS